MRAPNEAKILVKQATIPTHLVSEDLKVLHRAVLADIKKFKVVIVIMIVVDAIVVLMVLRMTHK